jgi:hypothetical protein
MTRDLSGLAPKVDQFNPVNGASKEARAQGAKLLDRVCCIKPNLRLAFEL